MELREKIAASILDAMDVADGLDATAAERYAEAVLAIPEIRDALYYFANKDEFEAQAAEEAVQDYKERW